MLSTHRDGRPDQPLTPMHSAPAQKIYSWTKNLLWVTTLAVIFALTLHAGVGQLRSWSIYFLLLPTLAGVIYLHRNLENPALPRWGALLLLTVCMFCVDISQVVARANPTVKNWLQRIVEDPQTTSYYTDAMRFVHQPGWIAMFQFQTLSLHSSTHPVGPILFYVALIHLLGPVETTFAGPLLIAAFSSTSILAMYFFSGIWTDSRKDRLLICLLWTLCPAIGLIFPEFDQVYPVLSMVMLAAWVSALRRSMRYAALLGFASFLATLFAYNLLVVGTFIVAVGTGFLWIADWRRSAFLRALQAVLIAAGLFIALHLVFSLATGYHPVASFVHSLQVQKAIEVRPKGLYSRASNIYNYSLGSGFLPEILAAGFLLAVVRGADRKNTVWIATVSAAITLLAVEVSGVLDYEAQRVWLFLQPLIFVPAALQLAAYPRRDQSRILVAEWLLLATIGRCLLFVVPFH